MSRLERQEDLAERIINYQADFLDTNPNQTEGLLIAYSSSLIGLWEKFSKDHERILKKSALRNSEYIRRDVFATTQQAYNATMGFFYDERQRIASSSTQIPAGQSLAPSKFHLPKISLPKFSGDEEDWEGFRDLFLSLVHQDVRLSNVEKHHFLVTSLEGEARDSLRNLKITETNYLTAWNILLKRYDNPELLVTRHLSVLSTLPTMTRESSAELQTLLDTVSSKREALKALGLPIKHWDTVFIFFLTQALDPVTRKDWEKSGAARGQLSSLSDYFEFLQNQIQALKSGELTRAKHTTKMTSRPSEPRMKARLSSYSTMVSSEGSSGHCPACPGRHPIIRCPQFLNVGASQRRRTVLQLRLCFNCLKPDHTVRVCSSAYSCKKCQGRHHTFLHDAEKRQNPFPTEHGPTKRARNDDNQQVQDTARSKTASST